MNQKRMEISIGDMRTETQVYVLCLMLRSVPVPIVPTVGIVEAVPAPTQALRPTPHHRQ